AVVIGQRVLSVRAQLCQGAERNLAGVWDQPTIAKVGSAFQASRKSFAADAFRGVQRELGAYASAWTAMHTEACQATRLRGEQSDELLARRMICLDQRLGEMRALTALFARADAQVVQTSVEAASALPGLEACA